MKRGLILGLGLAIGFVIISVGLALLMTGGDLRGRRQREPVTLITDACLNDGSPVMMRVIPQPPNVFAIYYLRSDGALVLAYVYLLSVTDAVIVTQSVCPE